MGLSYNYALSTFNDGSLRCDSGAICGEGLWAGWFGLRTVRPVWARPGRDRVSTLSRNSAIIASRHPNPVPSHGCSVLILA